MSKFNRREFETDRDYVLRLTGYYMDCNTSGNSDQLRELKNHRMYSAVNAGQWDSQALRLLEEEGRPAHQINLLQGTVDTVAGILLQNPHEAYFSNRDIPEGNEGAVNLAQFLYEYDINRTNMPWEKTKFIRDGLIFKGVAKWEPDYRDSPLGNVAWKNVDGRNVLLPSNWCTDDVRELQYLFERRYVNIEDIKTFYGTKSPEIMVEIERSRNSSLLEDVSEDFTTRYNAQRFVRGSEYLVIELHYMVNEYVNKVYNLQTGQPVDTTALPANVVDSMVVKNPEKYKKVSIQRRTSRMITLCPGISLNKPLTSGEYPYQFGRLPYDIWAYKNLNGEIQGIVDTLGELQELLNKRESSIHYWEATQGNASIAADSSFFSDNSSLEKFRSSGNTPGQVHVLDGAGRNIQQAFAVIPNGAPPTFQVSNAVRMENLLQKAAGVDLQNNPENANTRSSTQFADILDAKLARQEILNQSLLNTWAQMVPCYLKAAQYIYSGAERPLHNPATGETITLNYWNPETGETDNDISTLERYSYRVAFAPTGTARRKSERSEIDSMIQISTNPLAKTLLEEQDYSYLDLPKPVLQRLKAASELFYKFQEVQMQTQIQQMQAPPQAQATPGMPPDAKEAATGAGQGELPGAAGIAGSGTAANNVQTAAPSDMGSRTT